MAKNSQEYWNRRARQDKIKVIKTSEMGVNNLKKLLKKNLDSVEKQIKEFYKKYGDEGKYAENLSYAEFQKYKAKLKLKAKQNPQDKTLQRLAKQDIPKYRIDRLRALQTDLQIQLTEATRGQEAGIYKTLKDVAKVSQATTALRFKKTLDVAFDKIASRKLEKILSSDWVGNMNWSERLWKDRELVGKKVTEILEEGIPQGKSMQDMARDLKDATNSSFNDAFRLIRTEAAHVDGEVLLESFKQAQRELGYEYYIYDATIDNRTSDICKDLDNKRFKISEAVIGVNFPPVHPNCFDRLTQVMTNNGFKYFIDLCVSDKVLTLNPETLETEYQEPIAFYRYKYSGFMLLFEDENTNIKVTPEHNMLESGKLKRALLCEKLYHDTGKLEFINDFNKKYEFQGLIKRIPYNDDVFCVEVAKYNTLLVKRKNKYVWCGNCRSTAVLDESSIDESLIED